MTEINLNNGDKKIAPAKVEPFADCTPCNWEITANDNGTITAYNGISGETFEGDMATFNKGLRG